ncbi:hypothetical protein OEA41_004937 [Lepraria neglecta]|uniref:WD40 repeat-like protein n=1 Tax=Lepraria neglecta TaxID=209136 RepID=A0AAE0DGB1_9LECA|nr:hypothetical protein OEA41_004937 [Lepraria neglecta]
MEVATLTKTSSLSLPADSYIYKILQIDSNLAAISSDDSLRIIDSTSLKEIAGGILKNVHAGVTCLEAPENDKNVFLTAGRDAVVRSWDLRDNRSPSKPVRQYIESHSDDVTELQFHPHSRGTLLSGSTDGLVNIYNIDHSDEDDALSQVANHGSSIHHAGFLSNSQFFALSHDETFSIYQLESQDNLAPDVAPHVFGDLRPKLECEYIVDIIPHIGSGEAILGAGSHSKHHLDLVPLQYADNWSFDQNITIRLPGAHGEEIVRSMLINHDAQTIFTAGEGGLIRAWRTSAENAQEHMQEAETPTETEKPKKKKKKKKDHAAGDEAKGRFKPY